MGRHKKIIEESQENMMDNTPNDSVESENITIPKDQLRTIVQTIEVLKDQMEKQKKESQSEIEILRDSVNRSRLETSDIKHGKVGDQRPRGHLKKVLGKIIVGWKSKNESPIIAQNRVVFKGATPVDEIVNLHAIFIDKNEDGTQCEDVIPYIEFAKATEYVYFRVNSVKTVGNELIWTIEFEDSNLANQYKEIELPVKFANA